MIASHSVATAVCLHSRCGDQQLVVTNVVRVEPHINNQGKIHNHVKTTRARKCL